MIEILHQGLTITPAVISNNHVSRRRSPAWDRPIIDINSSRILGHLTAFDELKVVGSFERLDVTPSIRAFNITRAKAHTGPHRVLDLFSGGGTISDGLAGNPAFKVVAGVDIDPDFSDEFAAKNPEADIILGDFRRMMPEELPDFDGLIAGVPCVSHSRIGRGGLKLGSTPELGEAGDLYVPVLALMAAKMPSWAVIENVPAYGTSLAGRTVAENLRKLGYDVHHQILHPNSEWNEPTTRDRWVLVATLKPGFQIRPPMTPFNGTIAQFLDQPDFLRDFNDADRISRSIAALRRNSARQAATGHGFPMRVLNGSETSAPTLCSSYHKVNTSGFFVDTAFGPRMLRKDEISRLQGQTITCPHYATAVAMMGQGGLTRVFREVFSQLGNFLSRQ